MVQTRRMGNFVRFEPLALILWVDLIRTAWDARRDRTTRARSPAALGSGRELRAKPPSPDAPPATGRAENGNPGNPTRTPTVIDPMSICLCGGSASNVSMTARPIAALNWAI